ncbi:hypothetical protein A1355_03230 [Methylomonas koyamae]|uniref:Uncharacterized protein n=1 Tax=Methylomonas koyamae TaxID=702114 RepID=A0A177NR09_9GAMM|nr:hypothetical protein A1355_03230 [Methylomonas koyamae]
MTVTTWPSLSNKTDAVKSGYKLPKHVFELYKSASLHTKQERKLPVQVYILAACLVGLVLVGMRFKARYDQITSPVENVVADPGQMSNSEPLVSQDVNNAKNMP